MTIEERIDSTILDINAQIERIRVEREAQITSLQTKKAALVEAKKILTPQLEATLVALQKLGFIREF